MKRHNKGSNSGKFIPKKEKTMANTSDLKKKGKTIQCREYEDFGHIQSECANTLKKKGKSIKMT